MSTIEIEDKNWIHTIVGELLYAAPGDVLIVHDFDQLTVAKTILENMNKTEVTVKLKLREK